MTAHLTDKPPAGFEGANATRDGASGSSLIQCSTALEKTASNSFSKVSRSGVHDPRIQTAPPRGCDHVRSTVDAHHFRPQRDQFFGKHAVSATQVEDALATPRLEQVQHRLHPARSTKCALAAYSAALLILGRGTWEETVTTNNSLVW